MAVTSKEVHSAQQNQGARIPLLRQRAYTAAIGVTLLLAAIAVYALVGLVVDMGRVALDDLRYGRPRTFHIVGIVGNGAQVEAPTHFSAVNLNRQIVIFVLPGGDPAHAYAIQGPYLFGAQEDLTPVTLKLQDVDNDGKLDLLVDVRRERIIYLNRDGTFRLPTRAEQATLRLESIP